MKDTGQLLLLHYINLFKMADNITFMEISHITMMEDISAGDEMLSDDGDDYDYFDVTQRASRILGKPTRIIASILGTFAVTANVTGCDL